MKLKWIFVQQIGYSAVSLLSCPAAEPAADSWQYFQQVVTEQSFPDLGQKKLPKEFGSGVERTGFLRELCLTLASLQ